MTKRYELLDEVWAMVTDLFVEKRNQGQPRLSDRLMLDA
jgi:transposase